MNLKIFEAFRILSEKENHVEVQANMEKDSVFIGTNLWILFFAILIASLGLNLNSTAVIIGAMLISPLMGPILGIGFGVAVNNLTLLRRALKNYLFAAGVGLVASTIYFLISPINDAHSEILARTQPTLYDVFIAFFGGFAGILAICSKQKGNVLAGVAIATALMPPLCTAGYGLATWQLNYSLGALYLYLINSVFIASATVVTVRFLRFPVKQYDDPKIARRERRIVWMVVVITLVPSIYFAYRIVNQSRYEKQANYFIDKEAIFPNDYLLKKEIDPKEKKIVLTYGGKEIDKEAIEALRLKLVYYDLSGTELEIKQGFSFLEETEKEEQIDPIRVALQNSETEKALLKGRIDSITEQSLLNRQVFMELQAQYPQVKEAILQPVIAYKDSSATGQETYLVQLYCKEEMKEEEVRKLEKWLQVRLRRNDFRIIQLKQEIKGTGKELSAKR